MNGVGKAKRKGIVPKQKASIFAPETIRLNYIEGYLKALISDAVCIFQGRYSNADATRDCNSLSRRLRAEGSGFATKTLPCLITGILAIKEHGHASFPQFKLQRGTEHPAFLGRLFHLALYSVDLTYRVKALDLIYSISVAFKKLKGDYPVRIIRKLFADFVKTDVDLKKIDWHSKPLRLILEDARHQWRIFVAETNLAKLIEESTPQPGPGATNTPTKKSMRYRPHTFFRQLNAVMPYKEWFYPTPKGILASKSFSTGVYNITYNSPTARFKAVPKTVGKPRGICIEENETQCFQQAVRKAFYKAIISYFGNNIALRKQRINATLALTSSATLEHATIDESEASDRVARELVKYLSQDDPYVNKILMGLSTRYVLPPKELKDEYDGPIATEKYAPMGSALCFPVMSLVHMFLVRSIIRLSTPENTTKLCNEVYVYGDDIILPSSVVEAVYKHLPAFGMKLNKDKSFYKSHFRESCGIHAYNGVDITPVYCKYIPFHHSPDAQASVFAVESQLIKKAFYNTASFQRTQIENAYGFKPECVPEGLSLVGYDRPCTDELLEEFKQTHRRKWSVRYQCPRYIISSFKKRKEKLEITEHIDAYTRWMWTSAEGSNTNEHTVSDSSGTLTKVQRVVLESAIGPASTGSEIDEYRKRYPTASARVTHPSWFDRLQKNFSVIGCRCYL